MLTYMVRRILISIPVLWGVLTLVFVSIHLIPGDPAADGGDPSLAVAGDLDVRLDRVALWMQAEAFVARKGALHGAIHERRRQCCLPLDGHVFLAAEVFVDQLDGQGLIVSEIGGRAKPLDTEILGDDGLHDLRRSAVDRLDAGVDERA